MKFYKTIERKREREKEFKRYCLSSVQVVNMVLHILYYPATQSNLTFSESCDLIQYAMCKLLFHINYESILNLFFIARIKTFQESIDKGWGFYFYQIAGLRYQFF